MGEKTLFTIRDYKPADKPRLLSLLQMNIPAFFTQSELDDLNRYLDEGIEMYFVVEVDNEIIGAGGINFENNHHTGIISWDYFHPSFQGKGIGRALLQHRLNILKSIPGIQTIRVRTAQFTFGFYAKSGFVLKDVVMNYWAPGYDLYLMEIDL